MRTSLMLLCLLAAPAQAQWIDFTPCGKELAGIDDSKVPVDRLKRFSGPAQEIDVVWVWVPAINAIVGYRIYEEEPACTALLVAGVRQLYVVGEVSAVVDRVMKVEELYKGKHEKR